MLKKLGFFSILFVVLAAGCVSPPGHSGEIIKISAVQFTVREEYYRTPEIFKAHLYRICSKVMAEHNPDLIVFPEYTGVFLAVTGYMDILSSVSTLAEGLRIIRDAGPEAGSLFRLMMENAESVSRQMDGIFGGLAEEFGVYILAGTYFHKTLTENGEPRLYNRLVVYSPEGARCYEQDKVFLTPFEEELLGLSPGSFPVEPGIEIKGVPYVFTICRDSFFEEWTEANREGYIWIDIKANGAVFDSDARENFRNALPERLKSGPVPYGITVVLTGSFLELFWEGRSSAYAAAAGNVYRLAETESWERQEILHLSFPYPRETY